GGAGGIFVVVGVAALTGLHTKYRDEVDNLLLYAPPFTLFVIGLAALLRTLCRRVTLGRALTIAVTIAIAIVPMIASLFFRAAGVSTVYLEAASPLDVFSGSAERGPLMCAAVGWAVLGIVFLAVTHRREHRSAAAAAFGRSG